MYKICFTVKKIPTDSVFPAAEILGRMVAGTSRASTGIEICELSGVP